MKFPDAMPRLDEDPGVRRSEAMRMLHEAHQGVLADPQMLDELKFHHENAHSAAAVLGVDMDSEEFFAALLMAFDVQMTLASSATEEGLIEDAIAIKSTALYALLILGVDHLPEVRNG